MLNKDNNAYMKGTILNHYSFLKFLKTFLILFFVNASSCFSQNQNNDKDSCKITFVDSKNNRVIKGRIAISTSNKNTQFINNGIYSWKCSQFDSIYVRPIDLGYEDTIVNTKQIKNDTIILIKNGYVFEEIEVVAEKKHSKTYRFGRKNSKYSGFYSFQAMDMVEDFNQPLINFKLVSFVSNNVGKKLEITKGFVYLDKIPEDSVPNLIINLYKNQDGIPGKLLHEKIKLKSKNKTKGWFEFDLEEKIKIPSDGFFVEFEKNDLSEYSPYVGLVSTIDQDYSNTYSFVDSVGDCRTFDGKVVKIFLITNR